MKKYIIAFTLLFILFACGDVKEKINNISNEKVENDLTKYNLKGKVKEVIEKEYSIKEAFGETVKDELKRIHNKLEFDLKGNLKQKTYYRDSTISFYYIYVYDRNGNNIEFSDYNKEGEIQWKSQTTYEEKGVMSESKSYDRGDSLRWITKYEYDNNDQLIKNSVYNLDGELQMYWVYEYDKEGNMIQITQKNAQEDKIQKMTKRKYDLLGNITESITYDKEGKETSRYANVYNEEGLIVQYDTQSIRNGRKSTYSWTNNNFSFDDTENWTKYIRYTDMGNDILDTTLFERTYTYY